MPWHPRHFHRVEASGSPSALLLLVGLLTATALAPASAAAQSGPPPELGLELLVGGLSNPTIIAHAGDGSGRLFVGEQQGVIRIWDDGLLLPTPFLDIRDRVTAGGEKGLLGLAFAPDFATSGLLYVHYSTPDLSGVNDHFTVVSEFSVAAGNPNQADPASERRLLRYPQPYSNHNGGSLAFGSDGHLYLGLGDGGSAGDPGNRAQNLGLLLGKIVRIVPQGDAFPADPDRNYSIPATNPYVGVAGEDEIWASGLRNPWRFSFDRATGDLLIGDVGQNAWEEIDHQPAASSGGENYGWRCYEGNHPFNTSGCGPADDYVPPILEYSHAQGCSVTGGYRYRGPSYPNLVGTYLYADYCTGVVWGATREGDSWSSQPLLSTFLNVSTFGEDEAGEIYVADRVSGSGAVYRIVDTSVVEAVFADGFESSDTSAWSSIAQ